MTSHTTFLTPTSTASLSLHPDRWSSPVTRVTASGRKPPIFGAWPALLPVTFQMTLTNALVGQKSFDHTFVSPADSLFLYTGSCTHNGNSYSYEERIVEACPSGEFSSRGLPFVEAVCIGHNQWQGDLTCLRKFILCSFHATVSCFEFI